MKKQTLKCAGSMLLAAALAAGMGTQAFAFGGGRDGGRGNAPSNSATVVTDLSAANVTTSARAKTNTQATGLTQKAQNRTADGEIGNNGRGMMRGMDSTALDAAIDALEDSDTKLSLQSLLATYRAAVTAAQNISSATSATDKQALLDAFKTAREALRDALADANIAPMGNGSGNHNKGGSGRGMNVEALTSAIGALDDGDIKTNLESLLAAYQAALTAEQNASSTASDTEKQTLRDAVRTAREALCDALADADIAPMYRTTAATSVT